MYPLRWFGLLEKNERGGEGEKNCFHRILLGASGTHAGIAVEFAPRRRLIRPNMSGDDVRPRVTFWTNRFAGSTAKESELADMSKGVRQRSLDKHFCATVAVERFLGGNGAIQCGHVVEKAAHFCIPVIRSFRMPYRFAFGHSHSPGHQIGQVSNNEYGMAPLRSGREFAEAGWNVPQYFGCPIRQCG